jgi:hypothetical protein
MNKNASLFRGTNFKIEGALTFCKRLRNCVL